MMRTLLVLGALLAPAPPEEAVDPSIESGAAQARLDEARSAWDARGLADYDFRVSRQCFCPVSYTRPRDVSVRDGRPVSGGQKIRPYATVPRIFGVIQDAIDERAAILEVTYGPGGLPRRVWVDYSFMIADEENGLRAGKLRPRR